jgi:hypothetical protein
VAGGGPQQPGGVADADNGAGSAPPIALTPLTVTSSVPWKPLGLTSGGQSVLAGPPGAVDAQAVHDHRGPCPVPAAGADTEVVQRVVASVEVRSECGDVVHGLEGEPLPRAGGQR